jgi:hypothetical protein
VLLSQDVEVVTVVFLFDVKIHRLFFQEIYFGTLQAVTPIVIALNLIINIILFYCNSQAV